MTLPPTNVLSDASETEADMRAPERPVEEQPSERWSILSAIRGGLVASAVCHAVLILWAIGIWDSARPLAAMPPPSIAVDLVPSKDAPAEPGQPAPPQAEKQDSVPLPDLLRPSADTDQARPAPASPGLSVSPETGSDSIDAQVALANRLAETLRLPVALPGGEVDTSPAESRAKLARDIVAEFKVHLSKCWSAPPAPAGSSRLRVLIRVAFKRDGAFLKEPMLIQAVASPAGPALVKSAMKALQDCQPYAFMPADKYDEWKVMDLAFSPQGIL
jgi:hypothetical protein